MPVSATARTKLMSASLMMSAGRFNCFVLSCMISPLPLWQSQGDVFSPLVFQLRSVFPCLLLKIKIEPGPDFPGGACFWRDPKISNRGWAPTGGGRIFVTGNGREKERRYHAHVVAVPSRLRGGAHAGTPPGRLFWKLFLETVSLKNKSSSVLASYPAENPGKVIACAAQFSIVLHESLQRRGCPSKNLSVAFTFCLTAFQLFVIHKLCQRWAGRRNQPKSALAT